MEDTILRTVDLPPAVAGEAPIAIARGTQVPVRALVENVSGTLVFLATASQDIVGPGGGRSSTYRLRPEQARVYVLAPKQVLYAAGNGIGARVSVSASEALPLV